MIFESDTLIHGHIVLDFDAMPHSDTGTNHDSLADFAVFPDARSFENVQRMPDARPLPDLHAVIDKGRLVSEIGPVRLGGRRLQRLLALLQQGEDLQTLAAVRSQLC